MKKSLSYLPKQKKLLPVCLSVLFLLSAIAVAEPDEFNSVNSGICTFNLQGYELSKPVENAVVFGVSKIFETYKDTFGFPYPKDFIVTVTIIGDKDKFLEYQKKQLGSVISQTGYYSPRHREAVVWKNKDTKKMLSVLFHEVNHLLLRHKIPYPPPWINEGLSEYFEGLNVIGSKKRIVLQQNRHEWCKKWLTDGFPIEPKAYLGLSFQQWMQLRKQNANAAYTIGYSFVYCMMSNSKTRTILKELLWEYKKHGWRAYPIQTINAYYPGGVEALEKHWRSWIPRARKYRPMRALKKKDSNDSKSIKDPNKLK